MNDENQIPRLNKQIVSFQGLKTISLVNIGLTQVDFLGQI